MTVDFIPLKLYVEKVIKAHQLMPAGRKEPAMRYTETAPAHGAMGSRFYFRKVRYAGRFEHAEKLSG